MKVLFLTLTLLKQTNERKMLLLQLKDRNLTMTKMRATDALALAVAPHKNAVRSDQEHFCVGFLLLSYQLKDQQKRSKHSLLAQRDANDSLQRRGKYDAAAVT